MLREQERLAVSSPNGELSELQVLMFKEEKLEGRKIRVGFAFSTGESWRSSQDARLIYAGAPFLYKLQLHTSLPSDYQLTEDQDPLAEFMRHFQAI